MNTMSKREQYYDLEERTTLFAESIIRLCYKLEKSLIMANLANQLVRSATSIGANYSEANGASSKRDFSNKMSICKKEAKETLYWLRLIGKSTTHTDTKNACRKLWVEAHELVLIFASISSKLRKNEKSF